MSGFPLRTFPGLFASVLERFNSPEANANNYYRPRIVQYNVDEHPEFVDGKFCVKGDLSTAPVLILGHADVWNDIDVFRDFALVFTNDEVFSFQVTSTKYVFTAYLSMPGEDAAPTPIPIPVLLFTPGKSCLDFGFVCDLRKCLTRLVFGQEFQPSTFVQYPDAEEDIEEQLGEVAAMPLDGDAAAMPLDGDAAVMPLDEGIDGDVYAL
jgi:hypothetical protein